MKLIKAFTLNSIAVLIKMICLVIINKFIAIFVGPSGYAAIGQLQNIISAVLSFSTAGMSGAVVKYTAESGDNEEKLSSYLVTALVTCILVTFLVSICIYIFAEYFALDFFYGTDYSFVLKVLSFTLVFTVLNVFFISIVNGRQKTKIYVIINIASSIFSLIYSCILIYFFNVEGALFSIVTSQAVVSAFLMYYCFKVRAVKITYFKSKFDKKALIKLLSFSMMVIVPSLLWPLSYSFIRSDLISALSLEHAGNWDAMWRLSTIYLSFITTILGIYYLPKLATLSCKKSINRELISGYKVILPFLFTVCFCIYFLKEYIVGVLFSSEFILMEELFLYQLLGDFTKICAWLISYTFLAKAMVKVQLTIEISLSVSFFILSYYFVRLFHFEGVAMAHFVNNIIYLSIVSVVYYNTKFEKGL
jgi:PST family polysaccharide transporter